MRWPLFWVLLSCSAVVWANDNPDNDVLVQLRVKPVLCILDAKTPHCQMSFLVVWQSKKSGYYCVYNDFGAAPIRCWTDKREGEVNDERNVQTEFRYWMTGDDDSAPIAAVTVEVMHMDSDDRRRKRRGRHVWDIL